MQSLTAPTSYHQNVLGRPSLPPAVRAVAEGLLIGMNTRAAVNCCRKQPRGSELTICCLSVEGIKQGSALGSSWRACRSVPLMDGTSPGGQ